MKRSKSVVCLGAALTLAVGGLSAPAVAEDIVTPTNLTEWVSDDGGSAGRELPVMSANGQYVVFVGRSSASQGVWIKDRLQPTKPAWRIATGPLFNPAISDDGKVVAWSVYGIDEGGQSIQLLRWQQPEAVPVTVSLGDSGQPAAGPTDYPALNDDGTLVGFQSMDKTLDADVAPGAQGGGPTKVYVRDLTTGDTEMVSVVDAEGGDQVANGNSLKPDLSPDGRYVAFASDAGALQGIAEVEEDVTVEAEEESFLQVYLRDRVEQTTYPVSLAVDGTTFGNGASAASYGPTVNDDGSKVAFESDAMNLVADDTNADGDAFVRDMAAGTTIRVSLNEDGDEFDMENPVVITASEDGPDLVPNVGAGPAISGNGQFVAFESLAGLTADDQNGVGESTCTDELGTYTEEVPIADVYRVELGADAVVPGTLERQSVPLDDADAFEAWGFRIDGMTGLCTPGNNGADPAISADGLRVAFVSAGNLVGREVEEEEDGGEAVTDGLGIEPNVYLHRPVEEIFPPAPDSKAPVSAASGPAATTTVSWTVTYTATDNSSGVAEVELFVKRPGAAAYTSAGADTTTQDGTFTFLSGGTAGSYAFYTVATDVAGNVEAAPATPDVVTLFTPPAPVVTDVTAPVSKARSAAFSRLLGFPVRYAARDEAGGSGLAKVELYLKGPGAVRYRKVRTDYGAGIDGYFRFVAPTQGLYRFYTVATDKAGNRERVPAFADTRVVVDTTRPVLRRRMGLAPFVLDLGDRDRLMLRMRVNEAVSFRFLIRDRDGLVQRFGPRLVRRGLVTRYWAGRDLDGRVVRPGRYVLVMRGTDRAGNTSVLRTPIWVTR